MTALTTTLAPARAASGIRPLGDTTRLIGRELRRTLRSFDSLFSSLLLPTVIMLVFVEIFGGAVDRDGHYVNYVVPGVLILCVGMGASFTAISVAQDMTSGVIDRYKTLPMFEPAVLLGHVVAGVLRNLVACIPVVLVAVALGWRPAADAGGWVLAWAYLALAALSFTWITCFAGLVLSVDAAQSVNFVFLFVPYMSSGFVPVDTMPHWLRGFAEHQPFTPIIETVRGLFAGSADGATVAAALAWLISLGVAAVVASVIVYRRRTLA
ncbi:ABC transporter permease [Gryllotalpicola daejeonensis]|uniref:Transport permease protein n=1 Tax=Gryllotalpicola daejeonensis TaxID=993087 RepID=A0ABP7ZMQ2_9MICO